jgi:hypothetical protein
MSRQIRYIWAVVVPVFVLLCGSSALASEYDIRGPWVGKAQGNIFGAEGTVTITRQEGEDFYGVIEGGNIFGRARFTINGKFRGNQIFGQKDGHTFNGFLYADGTIRGVFRASDGDSYKIFLRRDYSQWGMDPYGAPHGMW